MLMPTWPSHAVGDLALAEFAVRPSSSLPEEVPSRYWSPTIIPSFGKMIWLTLLLLTAGGSTSGCVQLLIKTQAQSLVEAYQLETTIEKNLLVTRSGQGEKQVVSCPRLVALGSESSN